MIAHAFCFWRICNVITFK